MSERASPSDDYDEFGFLETIAAEEALPLDGLPSAVRETLTLDDGHDISLLRWGDAPPELLFLHGGGQNAHTWDTLMLMLRRPAIAIDLPGHGRSSWRSDRDYGPWRNAEAVAEIMPRIMPRAQAVIGMSLGGATTIRLAAQRPDLLEKAVIIDVTPQVNDPAARMKPEDRGTVALIAGAPSYDSLEAMMDAAVALSPFRSAAGVRRGVRHNARRLADGRWGWRYDLSGPRPWTDFTGLWDDVARITIPTMLVLGGLSKFVSADDAARMQRTLPSLATAIVPGAGHAVQSDQPARLAAMLREFVPQREGE